MYMGSEFFLRGSRMSCTPPRMPPPGRTERADAAHSRSSCCCCGFPYDGTFLGRIRHVLDGLLPLLYRMGSGLDGLVLDVEGRLGRGGAEEVDGRVPMYTEGITIVHGTGQESPPGERTST